MIVSGVVVKVTPGAEEKCARHLSSVPGVQVEKIEPGNLALVVEAEDNGKLIDQSVGWQEELEAIQGVYPTFIGRYDDAPR
jgi:nitrate reductase NapAB chaperone NapD